MRHQLSRKMERFLWTAFFGAMALAAPAFVQAESVEVNSAVTISSAATNETYLNKDITITSDGSLTYTNYKPNQTQAVTITNNGTLTFNLTGGNQTLVTSSSTLTLNGSGKFVKTGGNSLYCLSGDNTVKFAFGSGALIDVQQGTFFNGEWLRQDWTENKADLNIASGATVNLWDGGYEGHGMMIDALTGAGTITATADPNSPSLFIMGVDNGDGTFSGSILGPASGNAAIRTIRLEKRGTGTQILSGNNSYSGTTTVSAGTLQIGDGGMTGSIGLGAVTVASGSTLAFNRTTTTVLQDNTTNNGTISVKTGTLTLPAAALGGTITASENGVFNVLNKTVLDNSTINVQSTGSLALRIDDSDATAWTRAEFLALRGSATPFDGKTNITWDSSAVVGLYAASGKSVDAAGMFGVATPLYKTGDGELVISSNLTNATATPITVYNGSVRLAAGGAFSGTALVKSGTQFVYDPGAGASTVLSNLLSGDGELTVKSGMLEVTTATPKAANSAYVDISQVRILDGAVMSFADTTGPRPNGSSTYTIESGGTLRLNSSYDTLTHAGNASITNSATASSVKIQGAGTLEVSGGGVTAIIPGDKQKFTFAQSAGGWIDLKDVVASTETKGSSLLVGGWSFNIFWTDNQGSLNVERNSKVNLWDGNQITVDNLTGSGIVEAGAVRLGIANNVDSAKYGVANNTAEFSGTLRDQIVNSANKPGSVTKVGTGTQILSGDNTYTGATTVSAGTLQIGNGGTTGSLGTGAVSVALGATLVYNKSGESTVSKAITGMGTIRSKAGTLNLGSATAPGSVASTMNLAADKDARLNYYAGDNANVSLNTMSGEGTIHLAGQNLTIDATKTAISVNRLELDGGTITAPYFAGIDTLAVTGDTKVAFSMPTGVWDMNIYTNSDGIVKPWTAYTPTSNKGTRLDMDNVGNNSSNASVRENGLPNNSAFAYTTLAYVPNDVQLDLTGSYDDYVGVFARQLGTLDGSAVTNSDWQTLLDFGDKCARVSSTATLKAGYYLIDARVADAGGDAFANNASIVDPSGKRLGVGVRDTGGALTGDTYYAWTIDATTGNIALPAGQILTHNPNPVVNMNYDIADGKTLTLNTSSDLVKTLEMNTAVTGEGTLKIENTSGTTVPLTLTGSSEGNLELSGGWTVNLSKDANFVLDGSFTQDAGTQYVVDITGITDGFNWFTGAESVTGLDNTSKFTFTSSDNSIVAQDFTFFEGADLSGVDLNWSEMIKTDGTVQLGGAIADNTGLHITLGDSASVPEPSSWLLLILGACGLGWYRRKR